MKRIVIEVHLKCDKCRRKALQIAAVSEGVQSILLGEGKNGDAVVVIGEGVDAVCLTNKMRKKFPSATLSYVEDVEDSDEVEGADEGHQSEEEQEKETNPWLHPPYYPMNYIPLPIYHDVVYDSYPSSCSIL